MLTQKTAHRKDVSGKPAPFSVERLAMERGDLLIREFQNAPRALLYARLVVRDCPAHERAHWDSVCHYIETQASESDDTPELDALVQARERAALANYKATHAAALP